MKNIILILCSFLSMFSIAAQTKLDPKDVQQTPSYRFVTEAQIAGWSKPPALTSVPNSIVTTDALHQWVTAAQIAAWNKAAENKGSTGLSTDAITETPRQQFVTADEKARWNANTKIRSNFNVGVRQVDSVTIEAYLIIPQLSDWDMKRLPFPAGESIQVVINTDYKKLYYRTAITPWKQLWDSETP